MTTIKILRSGLTGEEEHRDLWVARPPRAWEATDAKTFLHTLQEESATTDCPLLYLDLIRVHESIRPNVIVIEVATNAGLVMTEPMCISMLALVWLDEAQYDARAQVAPPPARRKRSKRPVIH